MRRKINVHKQMVINLMNKLTLFTFYTQSCANKNNTIITEDEAYFQIKKDSRDRIRDK